MSIKNMTFVVFGAILGGLIGGILMKSIFAGIAFTVLLLLFFVMWRYFKNEGKEIETKNDVTKDEVGAPPVSVTNIPQQSHAPTYPQNTSKGM